MNEREIERWTRGRVYRSHGMINFDHGGEFTILDLGEREVTSIGAGPGGKDKVRRDSCGAEEMLVDAIVDLVKDAVAELSSTSGPAHASSTLERLRSAARERKARRRGAREMILRLAHRDGFLCSLCDEPMPDVSDIEVDHVIPVSKGGTSEIENLKLAHSRCNAKKGNRT